MLIAFGALCIIAGVVGILFSRRVAEFVMQAYRMMGGNLSGLDPIPLFSVTYRVIGVVQIGLGVILIYLGLRP